MSGEMPGLHDWHDHEPLKWEDEGVAGCPACERQWECQPMADQGTDLYGTRAIPQNGQPVHDRCGKPLRWSVAYDEPHWVHTSAADVMACPPVRGSL